MKHKFGSFSDAIRAGAMLRPQCFGGLERNGATCAIGAGIEAMGLDFDGWPTAAREYPYLADFTTRVACPECSQLYVLYKVLTHLNDVHRWTRESIADFLQSEEDKLGFVTISETEESEALRNLTQELSDLGEALKVTV